MSKQLRKPLSIALGTAIVTSLGATGVANAEVDGDIFAMQELNSAYLTAGAHEKDSEGKCGEEKKGDEGKCGEEKKKDGEGKCGEGKCGGA